jgi:glycosyltransferase involved in cell wall biosynthesis
VQNPDDLLALEAIGVAGKKIVLIPGSGVDTDALTPMPEPSGPITVGFAGRLLADKGIRELVAAHGMLRERGFDVRLLIAGEPDPANPASISQSETEGWTKIPGINFGLVRISRHSPRIARAFRRAFLKPRLSAARSSQPTCRAAGRSR